MKNYTVTITPTSSFMTPIESDTLFGHICWAMEYLGIFTGDKYITAFLEQFNGPEPPLIISSAFPEGFLPFPLLPPMPPNKKEELETLFIEKRQKQTGDFDRGAARLEYIQCLKQLARHKYISLETFERFRRGLNKYDLYQAMLNNEFPVYPHELQIIDVNHNAVNRITGEVNEGKFFSGSTVFYPEGMKLSIYLKTDFFSEEELKALFGFIAVNGFGGDKTTGHGRFDFQLKAGIPFTDMEDFNAYLLLSNTNPSILKKHPVYYAGRTKFGKVGGEYSMTEKVSPLKNPVIILEPGAIVKTNETVEYFGENFNGIHPQLPGIRHYGIGFPLKMRLADET